jgi:predicted nuclease of predicted toxin-antitoxin system
VSDLRFLADMNISPQTVSTLQQHGWDIIRVSQILAANAPDAEILDLARREDRAVITQDLDFSTLLALGGYQHPSLITLRLSTSDPETVTRRLLQIFDRIEEAVESGSAVTVEDTQLRIRSLPIK